MSVAALMMLISTSVEPEGWAIDLNIPTIRIRSEPFKASYEQPWSVKPLIDKCQSDLDAEEKKLRDLGITKFIRIYPCTKVKYSKDENMILGEIVFLTGIGP